MPAFHINLLERALAQREVPLRHCLRFIRSGSAPLPVAVRQGLEEVFGVPVLEGYGLTETGTLAANSIAPEQRKPGTVGRPPPQEVAVRAEDGRLLPPGSRRAKSLCAGTYQLHHQTIGDVARLFDDFRAVSARPRLKSRISASKADISHL